MYNFIDTTEHASSSYVLPSEAVSLDGEYIESKIEGFRTLAVSGRESIEYDVSADDRPTGIDGTDYYGKRQPARELTIKFQLKADTPALFIQRYRELKKFCSGENREIRFADEPTAHYTGTLKEIEKPDSGLLQIISTMTFYCADPYLVSDVITTVTAADVDGIITANVENDGSVCAFPVYRLTHSAENGYIGIVHPGGVFEMGNIDEADTISYTKSEGLSLAFENYTGTDPQDTGITLNGSLKQTDKWFDSSSLGSGNYWHGGCMRAKLPADSNGEVGAKNFYLWWESRFMTGAMGQTGFSQIILTDEDDKMIASFNTNKSDMSGNSASVNILLPSVGFFKSFNFTPSVYTENPFRTGTGAEDILKEGSRLRFYFNGGYYNVDIPAIAEKKVTYVYIVIGQYGTSSKYITVNQIGKIAAVKNKVDAQKDVPNRYPSGSEVVIDTSDDSITIDGLPRNSELVTGSEFKALPPGTNKIEFYTSSWCTSKPNVSVEFRKRWL